MQVSTIVSLVVWQTVGCYCKVVAIGSVYSCVSGTMVDRWVFLLSGCCRQVSIVVSLVVW